jgi:aspartyl-tRNA(Asn)/glutamyl-tRNA(Gln) amidotransferase subunit A
MTIAGPPLIAECQEGARQDAQELLRASLARAAAVDDEIGAFVEILGEDAQREAAMRDSEAPRGSLHGVPVAVKDMIDVAGHTTRCGSAAFHGDPPARGDADVVSQLREAGCVIVAKARMHECGYGMQTPGVRNPRAPDHVAGGSSGGSAAAVAAGLVSLAIGTDTAGSVRVPAACCGVVGFKPTRGLLSLHGVRPLSPSCDHVGLLTRTVADCRLAFQELLPATGAVVPRRHVAPRIGWLRGDVLDLVDAQVDGVVGRAGDELERSGFALETRELPLADARAAVAALVVPELWRSHAARVRQRGCDSYGAAMRAAFALGRIQTAEEYLEGRVYATWFASRLEQALCGVDVLALPTTLVLPPKIGQNEVEVGGRRLGVQAALTALTGPFNCCDAPVISVPAGAVDRLPVGLSLIGRPAGDRQLLAIAEVVESVLARRRPVEREPLVDRVSAQPSA